MKCPKCGYENDDNAYFCEGCGNKLKDNTGVENIKLIMQNLSWIRIWALIVI